MLRAGCPGEEGADILGQLGLSGWSSVIILDDLIIERSTHTNSSPREVRVEVLSLPELNSSLCLNAHNFDH